MSEKIIGRNAVTEALNSDREIEKIILAKGAEGSIKKIEGKAKAKKIPLYYSDKSRMDRDADGGNHQGVIAVVSDYEYATVEEILNLTEGNLATVSCLTPGAPTCHRMAECRTYNMWKGLDKMISDYFSKITLADLAAPEEAGNDYVI